MMLLGSTSSIFFVSPLPLVLLPFKVLPPPTNASNAASAASEEAAPSRPEAEDAEEGAVELTSMLSLDAIVWMALGGAGAGST